METFLLSLEDNSTNQCPVRSVQAFAGRCEYWEEEKPSLCFLFMHLARLPSAKFSLKYLDDFYLMKLLDTCTDTKCL